MDAFEAEELKHQVEFLLSEYTSTKQKLFIIKDFYSRLISSTARIIIEAYVNDFADDFLTSIRKFEAYFCEPQLTEEIIKLLVTLKQFYNEKDRINEIDDILDALKANLNNLFQILDGKEMVLSPLQQKISFPVLEVEKNSGESSNLGSLESFTIDIKKNIDEDSFIIIPSSKPTDKFLLNQIGISWKLALNYINKQHGRVNKYHKVIIQFDRLLGNYIGSSLGAVLTINFIEELIKFYNLSFVISNKNKIALTGEFDNEGKLPSLDESIIERKLEVIFYSYINIFVVPESNKVYALKKLEQLKQLNPKRDLIIVGITDLQDLLNRRNLIYIKKRNPVVRLAKYAKKNWVAGFSILVLFIISGYFYTFNYDDNPAILVNQGETLFVENQSGKVLFTKTYNGIGGDFNNPYVSKCFQMLVDINNDRRKELILADNIHIHPKYKPWTITCYDYKGKEIWNYLFQDTISSPGEVLSKNYTNYLIDTATVKGEKVLVAFSQNHESFGSAIYMLDLRTGKRVQDTFWHPGFIYGGYIITLDNKKTLVFMAINNSWHKTALGMLNLNNINGKAPSDKYHSFFGFKLALLDKYILLPNLDYQKIIYPIQSSYSTTRDFQFIEKEKIFKCVVWLSPNKTGGINYNFSNDLKILNIDIDDTFARTRDFYVKSGQLKPPLSDTKSYKNLLINQILYWNGSKFVHKDSLN